MLAERLLTKPAPKPKKRGGPPKRKSKRAKEEEARQRRRDLIGLGMVALAVYLGYIVYLGWDGGKVGRLTGDGLSYAVGAGKVLIPVALAAGGLVLVLRPVLGERRYPGIGIAVLLAGLLLALAAQTGGIGDPPLRHGMFNADFIQDHGGGIGEALYWATSSALGRIGAHLVAIGLIVSGVMMIRGRSLSSTLRGLHSGADKAMHSVNDFATVVRGTGVDDPDLVETEAAETERLYGAPEPIFSGEPETDTNELSIIPPEPDLGEEEDDDGTANFDDAISIEDAREAEADDGARRGRGAGARRSDPDGEQARRRRHDFGRDRLRDAARSPSPAGDRRRPRARTQGPRGGGAHPARDPRALRRRGEDRRRRLRSPREPLRAEAGAGDQGLEDHPALRRPRLRAGVDRHPHPRADPGQAGGRGRGPEPEAPPRSPRRHLRRPSQGRLAAGRLARQGHRRQRDLDRPAEDAARADRGHHRLG